MKNNFNPLFDIKEEGKMIFSLIQKKGPLAKNELREVTGMKLSSLNRIMRPLVQKELIAGAEIGESTGGRKPVLYGVNRENYYIIGIDISRTYTQVVVINLKMDILCRRQFAMDETCTPEKTAKLISEAVSEEFRQLSIGKQMILGAGLGTVGPLDRERGVMLDPGNFPAPGWIDTPVKDILERELGYPVIIDNGANTAVLAEFLFGDGKNMKSTAYFNCGIGIRTGVISSGNIVRTVNDTEDVFGHMIIDVDGERCNCGNYGCIECYSSIPAIVRKFISELKKGRSSSLSKPLEEINYIDICVAAEKKDNTAREVITGAAIIFGSGLANYINLLNPGLVILSGPLIRY